MGSLSKFSTTCEYRKSTLYFSQLPLCALKSLRKKKKVVLAHSAVLALAKINQSICGTISLSIENLMFMLCSHFLLGKRAAGRSHKICSRYTWNYEIDRSLNSSLYIICSISMCKLIIRHSITFTHNCKFPSINTGWLLLLFQKQKPRHSIAASHSKGNYINKAHSADNTLPIGPHTAQSE